MSEQPDTQRSIGGEVDPQVTDAISRTLEQLTLAARVNAAFGEPQIVGDRTIIPAAEVMCGIGFGMGGGSGPMAEKESHGSGAGAGGGARSRPVAAIIVDAEGVYVLPVVDMTKIYLAGISAAIFAVVSLLRLFHKGRKLEGSNPSAKTIAKLLR